MTKKRKVLIIYSIIFYALWAVMELIFKNAIDNALKNEVITEFLKEVVIKNLLWTIPAIALIKYFKDDVYIPLKEMFSTKVNVLKYLPIFIIFTIFLLCNSFVLNGKITISESFGIDDIIIFISVGLTEEIVFRGLLLNVTFREDKNWQAVLRASLKTPFEEKQICTSSALSTSLGVRQHAFGRFPCSCHTYLLFL